MNVLVLHYVQHKINLPFQTKRWPLTTRTLAPVVWATITSPCGIIVWTECVSHNTTQRVCITINFFISKWKQLTGWGGRPLVEGITLVFPKLLEGIIYIHTNTLQWWPWFTYNMNTTPKTLVCHHTPPPPVYTARNTLMSFRKSERLCSKSSTKPPSPSNRKHARTISATQPEVQ